MKTLVDNQLPLALARHLRACGWECDHVADHDLDSASDREIWRFAVEQGFVIISKDQDFFDMSTADPDGPPLVWVRLGNCRTPALLAAFDQTLLQIVQSIEAGQKVVELR